jgi:E3 ubiquitin-protein ligase UBR2
MWRRNGMNLPNQLQWYANSKCRNEMLDCDVGMMQTAASIMDPNVFIITLLGRFNLVNWAQDDYCHELQVSQVTAHQYSIVCHSMYS